MNNSLAFQLKLVQKHVQSTAHWTLSKFEIISPYTQLHTTRVERNVEEIPLKTVKRIHKTTNSPTCTGNPNSPPPTEQIRRRSTVPPPFVF